VAVVATGEVGGTLSGADKRSFCEGVTGGRDDDAGVTEDRGSRQ